MLKPATGTPRLLNALVLGAATFLFGCASRDLVTLDSRYEKTRLPAHFDNDRTTDDSYVSITAGARKKESIRFMDADSAQVQVRNGAYTVDASLLIEKSSSHFGFDLGFSPVDRGLLRLGAFWGATERSGFWLFSYSGGLFLNANFNDVSYIDKDWELFWYTETPGSSRGPVSHMEVPLRAGAMYDTRRGISPFANYSINIIGIGIDDAVKTLMVHEASAGAAWEVAPGHTFQVEASVAGAVVTEDVREGDPRAGPMPGLRLAYVKKL